VDRVSRRLLLALVAVALVAALYARGPGGDRGTPTSLEGRVSRVVDGDTIHVALARGDEDVRYIGIDTPETHHPGMGIQCYGAAATTFNAHLIAGQRVRLVPGVEQRDRYGRLLAYVYRMRDGLLVNAELARDGYARAMAIAPNTRLAARFGSLIEQARRAGRGLWGAC
jgi:micrococcal nuclease